MTEPWRAWIVAVWPLLTLGARVCVPAELGPPSAAGFDRARYAESRGQVADWTLSLGDGSRLHAHEYEGGGFVLHRDRTDPARGLVAAVWHGMTETSLGRLGLALTVGIVIGRRLS